MIILDFTCQLYDIAPKEGAHIPWDTPKATPTKEEKVATPASSMKGRRLDTGGLEFNRIPSLQANSEENWELSGGHLPHPLDPTAVFHENLSHHLVRQSRPVFIHPFRK